MDDTKRGGERGLRVAAGAVALTSLALIAIAAVLAWNGGAAAEDGGPAVAMMWLAGAAGAPVVGGVLAAKRPRHVYGWLLLSFAFTLAAMEVAGTYAVQSLATNPDSRAVVPAALAADVVWPLMMGHLPLLLLFFPDGRLPSRRWRVVALAVVVAAIAAAVAVLWAPVEFEAVPLRNPNAATGATGAILETLLSVAIVVVISSLLPAAASLFVRWRSASVQERLQLRWFTAAAATLAIALLVLATFGDRINDLVSAAIVSLALLGLLVAIGVAVLRYRLYQIDRIISRTVAYAGVMAVVTVVYVAAVTALTQLTAPVTRESPVAVAGATLLAAAVFRPVRRRAEAVVARRFDRSRYDAQQVVERFAHRMRDEVDLDELTREVRAAATHALRPAGAVVWLPERPRR